MLKLYRQLTMWCVILVLIAGAIGGRYLRHDHPSVDQSILRELKVEGEMAWEAPLLELIAQPSEYVDSYNPDTQEAIVGMYSWFGLRIGYARILDCQYGKPGVVNPNFGCYGGGYAKYNVLGISL
ncbi:MAG: hypothetical protein HY975_00545 [Candidatus Kerfeldbacteria bacterium]|nr:hypothetical protein [Candidatus Kerfeldbacteria bacterium]